ncbi:PAS domain S-box protein [Sporomusa acidovorans]|nr:PAS domain S-box protein [Sporomusa acidovorans]
MQTLIYQQQQVVKAMARMVDRHLEQGTQILDAVARVAEPAGPLGVSSLLKSSWEAYKHFDTIYYLDEKHKVVLMVPSDPMYIDLDMSSLPEFQETSLNGVVISRPFISLRTGNPTVYLIRHLSRNRCVVGELSLGAIQQEIAGEKGTYGEASFFVLDQSGTLLAHPDTELVKQQTNMGYLEIFRRGLERDTTLVYDDMGTKFMSSATRVKRVGWAIIDQISLAALLRPYMITFFLTILVTLGIWLTLVWNLRKQLRRHVVVPLVQLSQSTHDLAIGDYNRAKSVTAMTNAFAEVDKLANDFQRMSGALQARQAALQESEERYRSLFERVPTGLFRVGIDGEILDANLTCTRMLRFPDQKTLLRANSRSFYLSPEQWQSAAAQVGQEYFEIQLRCYDGTVLWVRVSCRPVLNGDAQILFYDGSMQDITKRKQTEEALNKAYDELELRVEERTAALAETNQALQREIAERKHIEETLRAERSLFIGGPTIVLLWKNVGDWPVEYISPNVVQILGYSTASFLSGKISYKSIIHSDDLEQTETEILMHVKKKDTCFEQEYRLITAKGEPRWFLDFTVIKRNEAGTVTHYHGYLNDITERKVIESKMAHLDRLNAIGEVAAGIAHEVRNPMTTVRGYLQFFQKKEAFSRYYDHFNTMIEELDRANSIITEFLSLAKNKSMEKQQGNLNDVVQILFPILQAEAFRKGHQLEIKLGEIPNSVFDEKEIRQLVLNMVGNGLDAMERNGVLTIGTYFAKDTIMLTISDTGSGIPAEVLGKLGTPFVTTKECGTGLGLSICYQIAARHGAGIEAKTSSKGTTFIISFPC